MPNFGTSRAVAKGAKRGRAPPPPAKTECPSAGFRTVGLTHSDLVGV